MRGTPWADRPIAQHWNVEVIREATIGDLFPQVAVGVSCDK